MHVKLRVVVCTPNFDDLHGWADVFCGTSGVAANCNRLKNHVKTEVTSWCGLYVAMNSKSWRQQPNNLYFADFLTPKAFSAWKPPDQAAPTGTTFQPREGSAGGGPYGSVDGTGFFCFSAHLTQPVNFRMLQVCKHTRRSETQDSRCRDHT